MKQLRQLVSRDRDAVLQVYREAVLSCPDQYYSSHQLAAWAAQAGTTSAEASNALLSSLAGGHGLVSCEPDGTIAAFAVRQPADRLALLYCRPHCQRRGHAAALLQALEAEACREGLSQLRTEASYVSRPLLERQGWQRSWQEELLINGVLFRRFRLHKTLPPILDPWPKRSSSNFSTKCSS